jgi:hypothetical protein
LTTASFLKIFVKEERFVCGEEIAECDDCGGGLFVVALGDESGINSENIVLGRM